jgi:hypothetical protein
MLSRFHALWTADRASVVNDLLIMIPDRHHPSTFLAPQTLRLSSYLALLQLQR